jgi:hypothetical protein
MNKEFPQFVHKKNYSHYFLMIDSEVFRNRGFNEKIINFSKSNKANNLIIDILFPEEYQNQPSKKIFNLSDSVEQELNDFYESDFEIGENTLSMFLFDYRIYDELNNWELYCSYSHEYGILGGDGLLRDKISNILNPYGDDSFDKKIRSLEQAFKDRSEAKKYFEKLFRNYPQLIKDSK